MLKFIKANRNEIETPVMLFEGERGLVITGIIGFILSAGIAAYIFFNGPIIAPEGNMKDAFSFNAAIGMFILSIAAILPLARFGARKRKAVRWFFIIASLYSYAIETIQNFRGLNPRFSREGTVIDSVSGMLFGVVSLVLVTLTIILTIHFFRMKKPFERPLLIMGIRYAFLSVIAANTAGVWMILLQDRFTGDAGNLILLHGIGFHALQTLILPAWMLDNAQINNSFKKRLIHFGSLAWLVMIILIGIQTALGQSVFKLSPIPILAGLLVLVWFGTLIAASTVFIKQRRTAVLTEDPLPLMKGK